MAEKVNSKNYFPRGVCLSEFFSYTFSAHEGTAYKARDTLSKYLLFGSRTPKYAPLVKRHFSSSDTPSLRCVLLRLLTRKKNKSIAKTRTRTSPVIVSWHNHGWSATALPVRLVEAFNKVKNKSIAKKKARNSPVIVSWHNHGWSATRSFCLKNI